jgi:hypothetical protein
MRSARCAGPVPVLLKEGTGALARWRKGLWARRLRQSAPVWFSDWRNAVIGFVPNRGHQQRTIEPTASIADTISSCGTGNQMEERAILLAGLTRLRARRPRGRNQVRRPEFQHGLPAVRITPCRALTGRDIYACRS